MAILNDIFCKYIEYTIVADSLALLLPTDDMSNAETKFTLMI